MEEILTVLPFGATFDLVQLKGSTLKKAFEHAVHRYGGKHGEFLQVSGNSGFFFAAGLARRTKRHTSFSGIRVEYDVSRPVNQRVVSLAALCTWCRVPRYEPLDPGRTYMVAMPSYVVAGGDGFTMIKEELLKHNTGGQRCRDGCYLFRLGQKERIKVP